MEEHGMAKIIDLLSLSIQVSRFRFWFYLAGPYAVGSIWAADSFMELFNTSFFLYLFYFLFPANVLLYGINDYFDYETDKFNPKKEEKEYLIEDIEKKDLYFILIFITSLSILLLFLQRDIIEIIIFSSFLLLSYFYSAKPIRLKAIPFLDFSSNFLFALPGVFAYYHISESLPIPLVLLAAFFHTSAMHLFSAIPDIKYDKKAKLKTTAVLLGEKVSMVLCLAFWTGLVVVTIYLGGNLFKYLTLIYPVITLILLLSNRKADQLYWFFPYLNIGLGGLLFSLGAISTPWIVK
jgi:4-hydroxybenzoate polyprenyltransferase